MLNGDRREHNKILPTKGHPEGAGQSFEISMAREGDFGAHSPSLILLRGVGKLVRSLNSWGCRPWMVWGTRVHIKTYCCLEGIRLGLIHYYWQRLDDVERAVGVAHGGHTGSDTGGPKISSDNLHKSNRFTAQQCQGGDFLVDHYHDETLAQRARG